MEVMLAHMLMASDHENFNMFNSVWFVVVTFSTVGYGDAYPTMMTSKTIIMGIIGVAVCVMPAKLNELSEAYQQKRASGHDYSTKACLKIVTIEA